MEKTLSEYRANVRAAVRGLWTDALDFNSFVNNMNLAIDRGFQQAWAQGAKQCGIKHPVESTVAEIAKLNDLISRDVGMVSQFGAAIQRGSKENGGLLKVQMSRADLWVNRYSEVVQAAKVASCGDRKMIWRIDPGKDNCRSCLALNGKVKRNSFWQETGILPQVPGASYLVCNGYRCGCSLNTTTADISRGRMPNLP